MESNYLQKFKLCALLLVVAAFGLSAASAAAIPASAAAVPAASVSATSVSSGPNWYYVSNRDDCNYIDVWASGNEVYALVGNAYGQFVDYSSDYGNNFYPITHYYNGTLRLKAIAYHYLTDGSNIFTIDGTTGNIIPLTPLYPSNIDTQDIDYYNNRLYALHGASLDRMTWNLHTRYWKNVYHFSGDSALRLPFYFSTGWWTGHGLAHFFDQLPVSRTNPLSQCVPYLTYDIYNVAQLSYQLLPVGISWASVFYPGNGGILWSDGWLATQHSVKEVFYACDASNFNNLVENDKPWGYEGPTYAIATLGNGDLVAVSDYDNGTAYGIKRLIVGRNMNYPSMSAAPAWQLNGVYQVGDIVTYKGQTWKCLQDHTAYSPDWCPGSAPSLWVLNS